MRCRKCFNVCVALGVWAWCLVCLCVVCELLCDVVWCVFVCCVCLCVCLCLFVLRVVHGVMMYGLYLVVVLVCVVVKPVCVICV